MAEIIRSGVIWDVETTGLNTETDVVIELGALKFEWLEDHTETQKRYSRPRIVSVYGGLADPGRPLLPEIIKLTGLTDKALAGKSLDQELLYGLAKDASIHVAHNAGFDSHFIRRQPFYERLEAQAPWACTIKHIDWAERGFKNMGLNYLAADHGFVNPFPHRAVFDCGTTFRLMEPCFQELLANHLLKMVRISAWASPFETKDILRENKYYWDGPFKVWRKEVLISKLAAEQQFLSERVYGHAQNSHGVEEVAL